MTRALALPLSALVTACLSVPDKPPPECETTADCESDFGEVCDEGLCWGNPPNGPFAALVSPPVERKNELGPHEFLIPALPTDGFFDVVLEDQLTYSGVLRPTCPAPMPDCDGTELAATIIINRASHFAGGPDYHQVAKSDPRTGAFTIALPKLNFGDAPYVITVVPDGRDLEPSTISTAQRIAPRRFDIRLTDSQPDTKLDIGSANPRTITGRVVDSGGRGLERYRVAAIGQFADDRADSEVSTVVYTKPDGNFTLLLSDDLPSNATVTVIARPYGSIQPTLHRRVGVNQLAMTGIDMTAPAVGNAAATRLTIVGSDPSGEVIGVGGARVTVTGTLLNGPNAASSSYTADGVSDEDGTVELALFTNPMLASTYRISVVPAANAPVGIVFRQPLAGDVSIRLPDRIALTGHIFNATGAPLAKAQVTARPSLRFQWGIERDPSDFLAAIPAATGVSLASGEYVVFVDPFMLDDGGREVWGTYDLAIEPPQDINAPAWLVNEIAIPAATTLAAIPVPDIGLPDAARIRGGVRSHNGELIEGAEVKLFRETSAAAATLCAAVPFPPANCPIPAQLLGRGASDGKGIYRLAIPR